MFNLKKTINIILDKQIEINKICILKWNADNLLSNSSKRVEELNNDIKKLEDFKKAINNLSDVDLVDILIKLNKKESYVL